MTLFDSIRKFLFPERLDPPAAHAYQPLRCAADLDALLAETACTRAAALAHRVARPCFHILPGGPPGHGPPGSSRLGGTPDWPAGASWPADKDGRLLTFYGQIKLEDLGTAVAPALLPARGLLSVFGGAIGSAGDPVQARIVLTPPGTALITLAAPEPPTAFADESRVCLTPVKIRFEPGLGFPTERWSFSRELEALVPEGDIDGLLDGMRAAPASAIGQLLGYAQFHQDDVHSQAYFAEIGRAGQDRLEIWDSWDDWEDARKISHKLPNGMVHRPWSAEDDDNVRWILANKAGIAAGIERWHSLLWISSNPLMKLWINDADPIYFLAKEGEAGQLDLDGVRAGATQS